MKFTFSRKLGIYYLISAITLCGIDSYMSEYTFKLRYVVATSIASSCILCIINMIQKTQDLNNVFYEHEISYINICVNSLSFMFIYEHAANMEYGMIFYCGVIFLALVCLSDLIFKTKLLRVVVLVNAFIIFIRKIIYMEYETLVPSLTKILLFLLIGEAEEISLVTMKNLTNKNQMVFSILMILCNVSHIFTKICVMVSLFIYK